MRYKFTVAYKGNAYAGWQRQGIGQEKRNAVQDILEQALSNLFQEKIKINGSGRTDTGVHAIGQVFDCAVKKEIPNLLEEINGILPQDIYIWKIEEEKENFHSRYHAISKTYLYRFDEREKECPFTRGEVYPVGTVLDLERMRQAAGYFIGTHDFKAFCTERANQKSTKRTIYSIQLERVRKETRKQNIEQIQNIKQVQNTKLVQDRKRIQSRKPVQNITPEQNVEPVQRIGLLQKLENIEALQKTEFISGITLGNCQEIRMLIQGDGFLYHMVRIIAGTLLEVGLRKRTPESVKEALLSGKRSNAGITLWAEGLWLISVQYE